MKGILVYVCFLLLLLVLWRRANDRSGWRAAVIEGTRETEEVAKQ